MMKLVFIIELNLHISKMFQVMICLLHVVFVNIIIVKVDVKNMG